MIGQMPVAWLDALVGGVMIGIAVSLMLFLTGRVAGISGILSGLIRPAKGDIAWRLFFIFGLITGGLALQFNRPEVFGRSPLVHDWTVVIAGLLVGYGTTLGSGCTSGHGICGISRFSIRSIAATMIFICAGVVSVAILKKFGVLP